MREAVLAANLALPAHGLVTLTWGNVSGIDRERGLVAIKPSGVPYESMTLADVVLVDLEGNVVEGERRPSTDTPTHLELYRAYDWIGGIVHTHSPFATAWAQALRELPCLGTTHADHFHGPVPVTRQLTAAEIESDYEERTGAVIVEAFVERGLDPLELPAALVASHGPFVWGAEVEDAVENAVALEAVAANAYRSFQLAAGIEAIPPELLEKHFARKHGAGAYYGQPA